MRPWTSSSVCAHHIQYRQLPCFVHALHCCPAPAESRPKANTPVCRGWQGNEAQPEQHAHNRSHGAGGPTLAHARAQGGVDWQLSLLQDTLSFRIRAFSWPPHLAWASTEPLNQVQKYPHSCTYMYITSITGSHGTCSPFGTWRRASPLWNELIHWASNRLPIRMLVVFFSLGLSRPISVPH